MARIARRRFLQSSLAAGTALSLQWTVGTRDAHAARGGQLAKYLEPVPRLGAGIVVAAPSGANQYSFTQREISRRLHPDLPPRHSGPTTMVRALPIKPGPSAWRWSRTRGYR